MKNGDALVSIVVPVYNAKKFLDDTINTVLNQTYANWELLLINDCSSDKSVDIIKKYKNNDNRIKLFTMNENSGVAKARNMGISKARGVYIAFLDADDLWVTNKLETQLHFMKSNNYAFTFTGYEFADASGHPNGKAVKVPIQINYRQALKNTIIWTSTVMVNTRMVSKIHMEMPDIRYGEDAVTWWRLLRITQYAYGINSTMSYYRRTLNTLSANKLMAAINKWRLYSRIEHLPLHRCLYYYSHSMIGALRKRV